jgi:hypothetical protein
MKRLADLSGEITPLKLRIPFTNEMCWHCHGGLLHDAEVPHLGGSCESVIFGWSWRGDGRDFGLGRAQAYNGIKKLLDGHCDAHR